MEKGVFERKEEEKIYSGLYDIYLENLHNAGKDTTLSKDLFMAELYPDVTCVDLEPLLGIDVDDFVTAAYVVILRRMPEPETVAKWCKARNGMSELQYEANIVRSLLDSPEFRNKNIAVKNDVFKRNQMDSSVKKNIDVDFNELISYEGEVFVKQVYQKLLERECDADGLDKNLYALNSGKSTKEDIICSIMYSRETLNFRYRIKNFEPKIMHADTFIALEYERFLEASYQWIFQREPDKDGFMQNLRALKTRNLMKAEVLYRMINSEEAKGKTLLINGCEERYYKVLRKKKILKYCGIWKLYLFLQRIRCGNEYLWYAIELANSANFVNRCSVDNLEYEIELLREKQKYLEKKLKLLS